MSQWPSSKAKRVLAALLKVGWRLKRQTGSHRTLSREGFPDFVFAFHDNEELGPRMLARIAKHTGLTPEDLWSMAAVTPNRSLQRTSNRLAPFGRRLTPTLRAAATLRSRLTAGVRCFGTAGACKVKTSRPASAGLSLAAGVQSRCSRGPCTQVSRYVRQCWQLSSSALRPYRRSRAAARSFISRATRSSAPSVLPTLGWRCLFCSC